MGLHKIFKIIALVLALAGIIFGVMIIAGNTGQIDLMMYVAYAVLFIVLALVVIYTLKNIFSSKETMMSTLKAVGAFLVVAIIAYLIADGTATTDKDGVEILSGSNTKLVNTGLYLFYALAIIASGLMLFTGVKKMISK